jgi:hypothetical protein
MQSCRSVIPGRRRRSSFWRANMERSRARIPDGVRPADDRALATVARSQTARLRYLTPRLLAPYVDTASSTESSNEPTTAVAVMVSGQRGRGFASSVLRMSSTALCWR